jgi:hypothetical protein
MRYILIYVAILAALATPALSQKPDEGTGLVCDTPDQIVSVMESYDQSRDWNAAMARVEANIAEKMQTVLHDWGLIKRRRRSVIKQSKSLICFSPRPIFICCIEDEGLRSYQPASASTVVSRKRGCGR